MAKLKTDPITAQDLSQFVASDSDFGLEMQVLAQLRTKGFACTHAGTYRDPITDKMRQYDIRAYIDSGDTTLALAVECKNLREHNPLLVSTVPRTADEAFHSLFLRKQGSISWTSADIVNRSDIYQTGQQVGKKTDQVGRDTNKELVNNDEATFEKISQAMNSCAGLVEELANKSTPPNRRIVVPFLVVPTGRLWQVDYDAEGTITVHPRQVSEATLFVNHEWSGLGSYKEKIPYRISHLEIITFDALPDIPARFF